MTRLVVKIGGGPGVDHSAILADVAALVRDGREVVLVHGGGQEIDRVSVQLGVEPRHVTSVSGTRSRLTDAAALDALQLALSGRVKPGIVLGLHALGVRAVGLTGLDGGLVTATRKRAIKVAEGGRVRLVRDDRSGRIADVRPGLLLLLTGSGAVPVVSPPALGDAGEALNVDADRMAAAVAGAVGASALVLLSNVPGLLRDPDDPGSRIDRMSAGDADALAAAGGRMRHKVMAAQVAVGLGVTAVVIGDGRRPAPVRAALAGEGTVVERPGAAVHP